MLPSVGLLVLDVVWLESLIGIVFVSFSSKFGGGLVDNMNWDFLRLILFTVVLLGFSFLITGCCFFFGLISDCSTLIFLLLAKFTIGIGENGRFCGGEWRAIGSGGGGGIGSSSAPLSSLSLLFVDIELLSLIFYIKRKCFFLVQVNNIRLLHRQLRVFDEILDRDCKMYNDIFVRNFLFVYVDSRQYLYVNQGHIQYEIFSVLFLF